MLLIKISILIYLSAASLACLNELYQQHLKPNFKIQPQKRAIANRISVIYYRDSAIVYKAMSPGSYSVQQIKQAVTRQDVYLNRLRDSETQKLKVLQGLLCVFIFPPNKV